VDVVGDAITELCGFEDADVRAERQDIDDGAVDRVEPERGLEPTLVAGWRSRANAEGLQASEHRSEPPSLRGHLDHGPSPAPSPTRMRPPALGVCQLGCCVAEQLEPTSWTSRGVHRYPGAGQCLDVSQHCALTHLQLGGKRGSGHPSASLQDEHQRDQSPRTHLASVSDASHSRQQMSVFDLYSGPDEGMHMAATDVEGAGTREDPWILTTPPGKSEFEAYRDPGADPPALVVQVGSTQLRYQLRCIDELHRMLVERGDWMLLGNADEQKEAAPDTVEAWGRAPDNPVGGWYGLKKGLRGRFGNYVPPVLEVLGLAEVEHNARNNRMRST
jgi:hypothetical protein